jgi:hypothetical protein
MSAPEQSGENRADRDHHGRLLPGHGVGAETRFGTPGNPPPKSPGRPKKDAWVTALERMIERDERLPEAFAARIAKIALRGRDADAWKALDMIQNRTGGPVTQQIEATVDHSQQPRRIYIVQTDGTIPEFPEEVRELEAARRAVEDQAQTNRRGECGE